MFPKKRLRLVHSILMSILMVFIMTAVVTFINTGMDAGYPARWARAFVLVWPVAFAIIFLFGPKVQQFSASLCTRD